jgi:hypothetical protein
MQPDVVGASLSTYLLPPAASAAILALEARAPRRVFWPIILVGIIALVTTGYRHAGVAPEFAAALAPLATAMNGRSTESYMQRDQARAGILAARWLVAIFCYAIVALAVREVVAILPG